MNENRRVLSFQDIPMNTKMDAAQLLTKSGWGAVCSTYPVFGEAIQAHFEYMKTSRELGNSFSVPETPENELEKLGKSLVTSIGKLAHHHFGYNQKVQSHKKKVSDKEGEESRSLIVLYKAACKKFDWIPSDEIVAHFAAITNVAFVAACREKMADDWEFTQREDGCWEAVEKISLGQFDKEIEELVSLQLFIQARFSEFLSEWAKFTNGKKK